MKADKVVKDLLEGKTTPEKLLIRNYQLPENIEDYTVRDMYVYYIRNPEEFLQDWVYDKDYSTSNFDDAKIGEINKNEISKLSFVWILILF